jgi:citrate lyase subunit beta-like protein
MLYVPGHDSRKLVKSLGSGADAIILDLEDGVPLTEKENARATLKSWLATTKIPDTIEVALRINSLGSGFTLADLMLVQSGKIQTIVAPKIHSYEDVMVFDRLLQELASLNDINIIPCIESARGVINAAAIANASKRNVAIVFAAEDLCADMGLNRSHDLKELLFARSSVVAAAKAFGLDAIDLVCVDVHDEEKLSKECKEGRDMGFTGKQVIHPKQVIQVNQKYSPSPLEIDKATRIVNQYSSASKLGKGAFILDGQVIDTPVVKWAEKILQKQNRITFAQPGDS